MPYVNIKITRERATAEQKAELIRGVIEWLGAIAERPDVRHPDPPRGDLVR
jgi:phenylpyruvate tautomerase PptA (4-oxalocrotonate tautomerase family)